MMKRRGGRIKLRMIGWKQMFHYNPRVWRRTMMMKERVLSLLWRRVLDLNLLKGFVDAILRRLD